MANNVQKSLTKVYFKYKESQVIQYSTWAWYTIYTSELDELKT